MTATAGADEFSGTYTDDCRLAADPAEQAIVVADAIHAHRRFRGDRYSQSQLRMLLVLASAESPRSAASLTANGLIATTILTLGGLERRALVSSEIVPNPSSGRSATVYTLTDKGLTLVDYWLATTPGTTAPGATGETEGSAAVGGASEHRRAAPSGENGSAVPASAAGVTEAAVLRPEYAVSEVLDFFEKCPNCGYTATATRTVRRREGGMETSIYPTCALPCGWNGQVRTVFRATRTHPGSADVVTNTAIGRVPGYGR
ncbi:hypothetical protein OG225_26380 [Nocardia sp. NBC_01377]|uniref:hypothetical protein n=1 Tax=Nocardia sp. NBC_01377 TaxID=2903595 RepID=UPI003255AE27